MFTTYVHTHTHNTTTTMYTPPLILDFQGSSWSKWDREDLVNTNASRPLGWKAERSPVSPALAELMQQHVLLKAVESFNVGLGVGGVTESDRWGKSMDVVRKMVVEELHISALCLPSAMPDTVRLDHEELIGAAGRIHDASPYEDAVGAGHGAAFEALSQLAP
jgi:hypothetical protein